MSDVGSHIVVKEPSLSSWRIKWCRTSICLVRDEITSVLAIVHVLWLSQKMGKGVGDGSDVSDRKSFIQMPSLIVLVSA